ncbi:MAG: glycoside hydrolase family 3 C-terminal domain-containing protein, partial [Clostridia bacterium]|nr:glycoside hydrolase family 3 C-terminal domain-containing protein [Clostridia bacterium]
QNRLIEAVAEANSNTVVVLHNGSPVEMPWIGKVKGVLEAYLGGQAVGLAEVKVLFGDVNPSGHLPESFPVKLEDNPSFLFYGGEPRGTEYREGIFVGYRYYDKKKMDVLFPFGYGLSYTTFEYSGLKLSADTIKDTDTVTATVTVKNTGSRAGKTVVQLYVGDTEGYQNAVRPVRELKGFNKVELQPGESKEVSFTLCKRAFAYWNTQIHDWHVETGDFSVEVGDSVANLPLKVTVKVESTVELPKHFDLDSIYMDILADPKGQEVFGPFIKKAFAAFGSEQEGVSEAAGEAISEDMSLAMLNYMPIRGALSFGGGIPEDLMQELLRKINS